MREGKRTSLRKLLSYEISLARFCYFVLYSKEGLVEASGLCRRGISLGHDTWDLPWTRHLRSLLDTTLGVSLGHDTWDLPWTRHIGIWHLTIPTSQSDTDTTLTRYFGISLESVGGEISWSYFAVFALWLKQHGTLWYCCVLAGNTMYLPTITTFYFNQTI